MSLLLFVFCFAFLFKLNPPRHTGTQEDLSLQKSTLNIESLNQSSQIEMYTGSEYVHILLAYFTKKSSLTTKDNLISVYFGFYFSLKWMLELNVRVCSILLALTGPVTRECLRRAFY